MVMVRLVHSIGGAGGVVEYVGWPDGIASVLRDLQDVVIGCRKQVYNLHVVPGKVMLWHFVCCIGGGQGGICTVNVCLLEGNS